MMSEKPNRLSTMQLEIVFSLCPSPMGWYKLMKETGFKSPHGLASALRKLLEQQVVRKIPDGKYELTSKFREGNRSLIKIMKLIDRIPEVELPKSNDPKRNPEVLKKIEQATHYKRIAVMDTYAKLAALARFKGEDALADFLKHHLLEVWFDKHYEPDNIRSDYQREEGIDISGMTFEECLKQIGVDEVLDREKQAAALYEFTERQNIRK